MSAAFKCFANNKELGAAIRDYVKDPSDSSDVAKTYGYPISKWCVDKVTSFDSIFKDQSSFGTYQTFKNDDSFMVCRFLTVFWTLASCTITYARTQTITWMDGIRPL